MHAHAIEVAPARFWVRSQLPGHWIHGIVRNLEGCQCVPHRFGSIRA